MKIELPENLNINTRDFLRKRGYSPHCSSSYGGPAPLPGDESFVKRLGRDYYPRFHVYVGKDKSGQTFLNLHLDQKKPSYEGGHAHSGEYDSDLVKKEGELIREELSKLVKEQIDDFNENQKTNKKGIFGLFKG